MSKAVCRVVTVKRRAPAPESSVEADCVHLACTLRLPKRAAALLLAAATSSNEPPAEVVSRILSDWAA